MLNIKETIMRRDGISGKEADQLIEEAKDQLMIYIQNNDEDSGYNICEEFFGLEPDYLLDLM